MQAGTKVRAEATWAIVGHAHTHALLIGVVGLGLVEVSLQPPLPV